MEASVTRLIDALRCLPGVGPKSAQRAALHLLQYDRDGARTLAQALALAADSVVNCQRCRNLSDQPICQLCLSPNRQDELLCVVESISDIYALEQATDYRGRYFVLHGLLSPLDGIGPEALGFELLETRLSTGIEELIIALNASIEGQATTQWIEQIANNYGTKTTKIAHGIPLSGDLDYIDRSTLAHALTSRR